MKKNVLTLLSFFILCTPVFASDWKKFAKDGDIPYYFDGDSFQCFKKINIQSGTTIGYLAKVWVKPAQNESSNNDMTLWSISCDRKIDKNGSDDPNIFGKDIKPDSIEEKLYKLVCSICRKK